MATSARLLRLMHGHTNAMSPNNRLQRPVTDKVLVIIAGQRPAAEPGR
jgi:hypothetical protein